MIRCSFHLTALGILFGFASAAYGLVVQQKTEEFGAVATAAASSKWDRPHALRYAPGRRYWLHSTWDGWGQMHEESVVACQGDIDAVNQALAAFAKIPVDAKQVFLFPAPGSVRSLDGKTTVPCDWQIQWTSHTSFPRGEWKTTTQTQNAVMIVYVERAEAMPAPVPRAAQWIKELDDEKYTLRHRAFQALADLRESALPALRLGLAQSTTVERSMRIEQLLARLQSIHVARLSVPHGLTVKSLDELIVQEQKNWHSGDLPKSWQAATNIAAWAEHSEAALPLLVEMLQDDREMVRDQALQAFKRLGRRASHIVPKLAAAQRQTPKGPNRHLQQALQAIEQGPEGADVEQAWRHNRELRQGVTEFCRLLKNGRS